MEENIREIAQKIAIEFQLSIKERTDKLLKLDAEMYTNLGTDSTKAEKQRVKSDSKFIYKQIKGINEEIGKQLLDHIDS